VTEKVRVFLALAGAGFVLIGLWWFCPPAAVIALGAGFVFVAYRLEVTGGGPRP